MKATPELVSLYRSHQIDADVFTFVLQLRKNLFEIPYAHTLLAFRGSIDVPGEPIGLAMYFHNYSTWTGKPGIYVRPYALTGLHRNRLTVRTKLEDLFVKPETRGMGVGKAFFAELAKVAEEKVRINRRDIERCLPSLP